MTWSTHCCVFSLGLVLSYISSRKLEVQLICIVYKFVMACCVFQIGLMTYPGSHMCLIVAAGFSRLFTLHPCQLGLWVDFL